MKNESEMLQRAAELGHDLVKDDGWGRVGCDDTDSYVCSKCGVWYHWLLCDDMDALTCDEVIIRKIIE